MTVGWSTAGFASVAELVRERTGLVFPDARLQDVEATIRRTMARLGIAGPDELLELLRDDNAARESFVADLTIGESYFQRDPSQFDLLRTRILPELLSSRPPDRPVRFWSAGCATGEEPYTVAMLFEELDAARRSVIVGTDIARGRLEDAQRGLYSTWQLRNTPESIRRRYFNQRGKFFELSPRIRQRVDFRYLNLAEDSFPSLTAGIWGMDVILCRNVLIYFDEPTIERVAQRLIASLSEDGWLLLGASDPSISEMVDCDVVLTDAGLAYRRRGAAGSEDVRVRSRSRRDESSDTAVTGFGRDAHTASAADATGFGTDSAPLFDTDGPGDLRTDIDGEADPQTYGDLAAEPADALSTGADSPAETQAETAAAADESGTAATDAIVEAYGRRDFEQVTRLAGEASASSTSLSTEAWTAWVRALANEGRHERAAETLTRAIDTGPTAELLYLHAVLLLQAGRPEAASAAARRALYMDPSLVVAHLTLAEAYRQAGNRSGERRALRNAAGHLAALDPETVLIASDGETAGRMSELVRVKLSLLGDE